MASSAVLVALDKQGRVNVDEKLRAYADLALESQVVVAGNLIRLEIWSPRALRPYRRRRNRRHRRRPGVSGSNETRHRSNRASKFSNPNMHEERSKATN